MSISWRQRLRQRGRQVLGVSEEEWNYMWNNIGTFCDASDLELKKFFKRSLTEKEIDDCVDNFSNEEFDQFSREVVLKVLEKHGFRKKKKKSNDILENIDEEMYRISEEQGQQLIEQHSNPIEERIDC